jgi:nonsense-mediated mRNA decay protein 3
MGPNPSGMCVNCIRSQVDITEGIPKQQAVQFCRGCERYLQPPRHWVTCGWESRELLTVCIKKLRGLNKVKLTDASFVWTEPHSKRIKTKLTVQKEVFQGTILQQTFVVEYVIENFTCENCHRVAAKDTWQAVVQVRQKVSHRRTFMFLEQLILRHSAHEQAINIQEVKDGIDFFFSTKQHAIKLVEFVKATTPLQTKTSERLISADEHTGKGKIKWTYSAEMAPICKDDLVCLSRRVSMGLGGIGPVCVCTRATSGLLFVDPNTLMTTEMNAGTYWKLRFPAIVSHKQLIEYTILDVEPLGPRHGKLVSSRRRCRRFVIVAAASRCCDARPK